MGHVIRMALLQYIGIFKLVQKTSDGNVGHQQRLQT